MTAVVTMYAKYRQIEDARRMFDRIPERDLVTWNAIISGAIHGYAVRDGFELLLNVSTALVDMYAKCSLIGIAKLVFDRMRVKNVVSWNSMIDGYAQCGDSVEAMALF
ncbi:hypothetical protein MRB53_016252 [Persea americana]|uniref:Uncharacterized protein n=1 Tax=Persea americana TaxID=3435 RepID=A0ACC2M299_PERAE|nr:hypothetical protein MRB53_016252 [Persea americana]